MAELGSNPSYVWRSLLAARDLIWEGSTWRVGDGKQIGVVSHKWLPNTPTFLHEPVEDMKVCDIINWRTRQWDRGKIATTSTPRTCTEILATPLNQTNSQDSLIWTANKSQKFTVKSAYQLALRLNTEERPEHSLARAHCATWGKIWKLNVPPKIRTFLWRACSNCLPTRDNLRRKKIQLQATCELCQSGPETVTHILWSCPFARNVWALIRGRIQKCRNEVEDFFLLFKHLQYVLEGEDLDRWAVTAWSMWNSRNKFYFEHI